MTRHLTPKQLKQRRDAGRASGIARAGQKKDPLIYLLNFFDRHLCSIPARVADIPGIDAHMRKKIIRSCESVMDAVVCESLMAEAIDELKKQSRS